MKKDYGRSQASAEFTKKIQSTPQETVPEVDTMLATA